MKILVTGVAGFIGAATARVLLRSGFDVVGVDNLSTGQATDVPEGIQFLEMDAADPIVFNYGKFDGCIHFSGLIESKSSMLAPSLYYESNVVSTLGLLKNLQLNNVDKFVFSSSAAVYGETESGKISEATLTNPSSVYGHTKLIIDETLDWLATLGKINSVSLRFFNAAGSYQKQKENHKNETHLIPIAIDTALGRRENMTIFGNNYETRDGTCIRDYVHVEDLAMAHVLSLDFLRTNSRLCANLGSGVGFTNLEIVKAVEKITGKTISYSFSDKRPGDPTELVADISLAKEKLGWSPQKTVLEAIFDSVESRK